MAFASRELALAVSWFTLHCEDKASALVWSKRRLNA